MAAGVSPAVFAGSASRALAEAVAQQLDVPLVSADAERFPDSEVQVRLGEPVRGRQVVIIQATSPPVDEHLVELLSFVDAARRAAAARVIAIVPYFGYARADRRQAEHASINGSLVARLLEAAGVDHAITVDLHAPQIEGFFHRPVDRLTAVPLLAGTLRDRLAPDTVVVSPVLGRLAMAERYCDVLGAVTAVLQKRPEDGHETDVVRVVGDVRARPCLIVDDIIATGGTMAKAIEALVAAGAKPELTIAATHCVWLDEAQQHLAHPAVRRIPVTDTVAVPSAPWPRVEVHSVASLLASALERLMS